mmetsp:Transcript_13696/g.40619  ORF Transcript_13696/g.40619 Transcript_13696/m.40619 type:complete len:248 (+) Transcript_13696:2175-2918(+)
MWGRRRPSRRRTGYSTPLTAGRRGRPSRIAKRRRLRAPVCVKGSHRVPAHTPHATWLLSTLKDGACAVAHGTTPRTLVSPTTHTATHHAVSPCCGAVHSGFPATGHAGGLPGPFGQRGGLGRAVGGCARQDDRQRHVALVPAAAPRPDERLLPLAGFGRRHRARRHRCSLRTRFPRVHGAAPAAATAASARHDEGDGPARWWLRVGGGSCGRWPRRAVASRERGHSAEARACSPGDDAIWVCERARC